MKNILVAIDDCQNTTVASPLIQRTIELASVFSSKVRIVHVVPGSRQFPFNVDKKMLRHEAANELHDEHEFLQQLSKSLRDLSIDASSLLVKGATVKTILDESDRLNIDLIILGRHKHGDLYNSLISGVEEGVLRKCAHSVMFVPTLER
ncbi:MAG: universal stress protein [Gammaproteobacteria bacterium]|nr:universal stress protein [Gammaproteobacteria bacterium]